MKGLLRVTAPYYTAGAVLENNICVFAPGIIKWMIGKDSDYIIKYLKKKGFKIELINGDKIEEIR